MQPFQISLHVLPQQEKLDQQIALLNDDIPDHLQNVERPRPTIPQDVVNHLLGAPNVEFGVEGGLPEKPHVRQTYTCGEHTVGTRLDAGQIQYFFTFLNMLRTCILCGPTVCMGTLLH